MKKNKGPKEVGMHQHKDQWGQVFGMTHPLNAVHKNKETQKKHNFTVGAK